MELKEAMTMATVHVRSMATHTTKPKQEALSYSSDVGLHMTDSENRERRKKMRLKYWGIPVPTQVWVEATQTTIPNKKAPS